MAWEPERWLLAAVETRPDDPDALVLLAGLRTRMDRLVGSSDGWWSAGALGTERTARMRAELQQKAADHYARALTNQPDHFAATYGQRALQAEEYEEWGWDVEETPFSFLVCSVRTPASNSGDTAEETIVLANPAELGWALDEIICDADAPPIEWAELSVYQRGGLESSIVLASDPDEWDWRKVRIPELLEPRLRGHPVWGDERTYHCGYNLILPY